MCGQIKREEEVDMSATNIFADLVEPTMTPSEDASFNPSI
jgi:hypothetical protein